ncbi:MAG: hypothetical protein ACOYMW_16195 [Candidatus Competibacteraceae bacterium]
MNSKHARSEQRVLELSLQTQTLTESALQLRQKLRELEALRLKEELSTDPFHAKRAAMEAGNAYWHQLVQSYLMMATVERLRELSIQKGLIPPLESQP